MSPAKTDDACLFSRQPDDRQYGQHFRDISESLAPNLPVANDLEYQSITVGKHEPGVLKVKLVLFKVFHPFDVIPDHLYCIYGNVRGVNLNLLKFAEFE